jgi:transposase
VYVDESGVYTCLRRETVEDLTRGNHFERVHIVGALGDGVHCAVEWYRHAADGDFFERWFSGCLLAAIPKGHTVIMDNVPFHRKKRLSKLARGKVRLLFLPPYSPDYNPIEKSWANMKRFLRNNLRDFQSVNSAVNYYFGVP